MSSCNLVTTVLESGNLAETFNYGFDGRIWPVYYSSDNCNNAYLMFEWTIPTLNPQVDELYKIHYCLYGADGRLYRDITTTENRFVLLNLMSYPLDSSGKFSVSIKAVLESYKGHSYIITETVDSLPITFSKKWFSLFYR